MRSHRQVLRRIPDWQLGCIDSKWKWNLPWGVFSTGLLVLMAVVTSLLNYEVLNTLSRYVGCEVSFPIAKEGDPKSSSQDALLILNQHNRHAGGRNVYFPRSRSYLRNRFNAASPPITELHQRFSEVPWDE